MTLEEEAIKATEMLKGKIVREVKRFQEKEVLIEFEDGTRFYVDHLESKLELSITGNFY